MKTVIWQIIAVLSLLILGWMGRYQLVIGGPYGTIYKLDRLTGGVEVVEAKGTRREDTRYGPAPYGRPQ